MPRNDELNHLIARYERMAAEEDARADWLVSMAMRLYAATNRGLAQEVRDGMT
jgi:hypothetical protein